MKQNKIENVSIISERLLPTPRAIKQEFPLSAKASQTVLATREAITNILDRRDPRLFVVLGPCSIHQEEAALEYAKRLKKLAEQVSESMLLVMRVYFEKPRTTVGWKGYINDPYLNDSFKIEDGLRLARKLLLEIAELGLGAGTEALDPITPQYLQDLISWSAIGARTTESQTHREMSSGLSTPVGFKNSTDGSVETAINALHSASQGHHFLGIDNDGCCAVLQTAGNRYGHIVLRGGTEPNYQAAHIAKCESELEKAGLAANIMVDCSHGNSFKDHKKQALVLKDCIAQITGGNSSIVGLMLESHLHEGKQALSEDLSKLKYGVSVTDACISWEETESLILEAHDNLLNGKNPRSLSSSHR